MLPVSHRSQRSPTDCLIVCAEMVLHSLGRPVEYSRLYRLLKPTTIGTPFRNIASLANLGVRVTIARGSIADLSAALTRNERVIVPVWTRHLPYWPRDVSHAVVIAGVDETMVWIHDPAMPDGPTAVPVGDFDLAWLDADELMATFI